MIEPGEPTVVTTGFEWVFTYPGVHLSVGYDHLREAPAGLYAELHVDSVDPESPGPLHHSKLCLHSSYDRKREAERLAFKARGINWGAIIDETCYRVAHDYRQGAPTVELQPKPPNGVAYLWRPLLLTGKPTILHAGGGTGKSNLALTLGLCVAGGYKLPGLAAPQRHTPVYYADYENDDLDMREVMYAILAGMGFTTPTGFYYRRMHKSLVDDVEFLRIEIERLGVGLLIVDSLSYACGAGSLNDDELATRMAGALGTLPCAKLLLAHQSKGDMQREDRGHATPFGSAFHWNSARSVWELVKAGDGVMTEQANGDVVTTYDYALWHQKANKGRLFKPIGLTATFREDSEGNLTSLKYLYLDPRTRLELMAGAKLADQIEAVLFTGGPASVTTIAETLNRKEAAVRQALTRSNRFVSKKIDGTIHWANRA